MNTLIVALLTIILGALDVLFSADYRKDGVPSKAVSKDSSLSLDSVSSKP